MAGFTRANGDLLPVAVFDVPVYTNSGVDAITSALPVQPQGPKLDFFTLQANANISANVGTVINSVVKAVEQLATVHIYEFYANSTNADYVSFALYPAGAYAAASDISNIANAATTGAYTWTANTVASFGV
jgi:hypothetical protein